MNVKRRRFAGGFSLIEAAMATTIIGVGIAALMVSVGAGTRANDAGKKLTQAMFLAQELREWTLKLPFSDRDPADASNPPGPDGTNPQILVDDLDDLLNVKYSPPRDGQGAAMNDMIGWSQKITITWRNPHNLNQVVTNGASDIVRVQVDIAYKSQPVLSTGWLVSRRE